MNLIRPRWFAGVVTMMAVGVSATAGPPEDALKSKGLKRVGSTYILPAEGEVQKKLSALKALSGQLAMAARHQAATEQQSENEKVMTRELLQQRLAVQEQLSAIEQQIRNMGGATPDMAARRNEVVLAYNGLGDRIRLMQSGQGTDPESRDRLAAEISRRREVFIQGVLDLRQLVDATAKAYAEIAGDPAVKQAMDELGRSTKNRPKLGPTSQFATNVKTLERIERSVMTDAVDVRKQGVCSGSTPRSTGRWCGRWYSTPGRG